MKVKVAQSCLTLCNPMDYTVRGILQARILEWVAYPFSRGSSRPRNWTRVSFIAGRFFTSRATREAQRIWKTIEVSVVQAHPDLLYNHKNNEFIIILVIWGRSVRNYWVRRKIEKRKANGTKCRNNDCTGGAVGKTPPANTGNMGSVSGLGRSPGGGNGNSLQYSCLGNPMDRAAWWATVLRVTDSQTWLNNETTS